ncbi:B-cell lymphoma/leukemia 10-like [Asterias rubens]|uniref:B-cell lymphoma/leukemia 10-like n=1 Tax=Asterias rubens TaxID=7604 RepID=UPI0014551C7E|nr:B-cell lymphoma/leukemia 10-like [Asterias rubens]
MIETMSSSNRREVLQNEEYLMFLHNRLLDDQRDFLCKNGRINPKHHYPYLRTKQILNRETCAEIDHVVGPTARANRFIDELQRNGSPRALVCFLESLRRDGTQIFVLKKLNQALANMRNDLPLMDEFQSECTPELQHQTSREFEESSIPSEGEGEVSGSSLEEGQTAFTTTSSTLLRPGDPGAPPLPTFEELTQFPSSSTVDKSADRGDDTNLLEK